MPSLASLPSPFPSAAPNDNEPVLTVFSVPVPSHTLSARPLLVGGPPLMGRCFGFNRRAEPIFLSCYLFIKACLQLLWHKHQHLCLCVCHTSWGSPHQLGPSFHPGRRARPDLHRTGLVNLNARALGMAEAVFSHICAQPRLGVLMCATPVSSPLFKCKCDDKLNTDLSILQ